MKSGRKPDGADSWINEDEEIAARSDTSSGGSSPSDLKKRLQHLPSPHDATHLIGHVANVHRRLSRKRDFYFHGAPNLIEENVEREENEQERDTLLARNALADLRSKDARARRRAKIRLEHARNRDMVISKSIQGDLNHEPDRKLIESRTKEIVDEGNSEPRSRPAEMEILNTEHATQHASLSTRPSINSPYRRREDESKCDSNRSQTNSKFLRVHSSGMSHESSPRDSIDLKPSSPVPFAEVRPTRFGGYRPQAGIILQNLSSGSEPDTNREAMSAKSESNRTTNLLSPIKPEAGNASSHNSRDARNERSNDTLPSLSLSSRRSSNHALVNSSRNDIFQCIIDSSRMRVNQEKFYSTALSTRRETRASEPCFFRTTEAKSTRSDIGRYTQDAFTKNFEEPWFFSAREGLHRLDADLLATPPFLLQTSALSNISPCTPMSATDPSDDNFRVDILSDASTRRSCEKNFQEDNEESYAKVSANNPNCQPVASTPKKLRSPNTPGPTVENLLNDKLDHPGANQTDTWALKRAISKCILNYNDGAADTSVGSQTTPSPRCKTSRSESQSGASTSKELFVGEFARMLEHNLRRSPKSTRNDEVGTIGEKEFSNVPALALTSQEVSQSTSPSSRHRSNRCLDADALAMALLNASQRQKPVKEESLADSKTVSRPCSSDLDSTLDNRSKTISLKSTENQFLATTTRTSRRSSLTTRSKIPIKIPTNRSKLSIVSKLTNVDKDGPIESIRQSFRRNSLSPVGTTPKLGSARSNRMSKSCDTSPSIKGYSSRNVVEPIKLDSGSSKTTGTSRDQSRYSSSRRARGTERNSPGTDKILKDVRSRLSSPLQSGRNKSDRPASRGQVESRLASRASSKGTSSNMSSIKRSTIGDTFESLNLADNWQEQKIEGKATVEFSDSSESDTDTSSSHSCDIKKPVKEKEQLKTITPRNRSVNTQFEGIQQKYYKSTYEGEVHDEMVVEKWKSSPMDTQIGDGGCQEIALEDSSKRRFEGASFDSSPEDEDYIKGKRIAENRDKFRFSLEKLAADQLRRSLSTEQTKTNQLDTAVFYTDRLYDTSQYGVNCSSSTSKLRHDRSRDSPRFKKKSQDRFPFTISEKTSVASMKFKVPSLLGNVDEEEEETGYKLNMHPSITRLAGSGSVDTAADIISYVARTELEDRSGKSTGMKGLVKKFSARWKKSKRRDGGTDWDMRAANVIYKNKVYREESNSSVESCSESSLLKGFKMYENSAESLCKDGGDSPDEKSSVVSDKKSIDRESSKNTPVDTVNPCRRYDRDDLWVQTFKNLDSDPEEQKADVETSNKVDEPATIKDPYSVFFVKSARESPEVSTRTFLPENDEQKHNVSVEKRRNRVKFRDSSLAVVQHFSNESVHEQPGKARNSRRLRRNKNMQSGCLCLRFYRMIVPTSFVSLSKYRSRINDNLSSVKKRSRFSSEKKKG